jgi:hypothetical protein
VSESERQLNKSSRLTETPQASANNSGVAQPHVGSPLGLEEIVGLANQIGLEYADAKKEAERLELLKPTVKSQVAIRILAGEGMPEVKLRRLTETDPEYIAYLEKMIEAQAKADRLRVRYDSYKNLFDAKRSLLSYQKAEMKLI